jgi:aryl-alcohol dehydrogenase-like predicted oxidoreductase
LCLGTVNFGTAVPREAAFGQLDYFYEQGGTFLDTAHVYADWVPGTRAASEKTIGAWIKERRLREKVVISTKGAHPRLDTMSVPRLGKGEVAQDLEESLSALGIECIDLYFLHRDDPSLPAAEILDMLEGFKKAGKIGHYGCSNWARERIEEAGGEAARHGYEGFVSNQLLWGIGDINPAGLNDKTMVAMDAPTFAWHRETQQSVMAYMAGCKGYFSKKRRGLPVPPGDALLYGTPSNDWLLEKLPALEARFGCGPMPICLAYIMVQPFPAVPIASFSSPGQLGEALSAADLDFPPELLAEIRDSRRYCGKEVNPVKYIR